MYRKPLEISLFLLQNRPRLKYITPLMEVTRLVEMCKGESISKIEDYTTDVLKKANELFSYDSLNLYLFKLELQEDLYIVTKNGKKILEKRLSISYTDGFEFNLVSRKIRTKILLRPSLKVQLMNTVCKASEVMSMSKNIGKEVGLEVRLIQP